MHRKILAAFMAFISLAIPAGSIRSASAEQYVKQVNGKQLVVHTNVVPVILHRVAPPYKGKHVSARQLQAGRVPPGARR